MANEKLHNAYGIEIESNKKKYPHWKMFLLVCALVSTYLILWSRTNGNELFTACMLILFSMASMRLGVEIAKDELQTKGKIK